MQSPKRVRREDAAGASVKVTTPSASTAADPVIRQLQADIAKLCNIQRSLHGGQRLHVSRPERRDGEMKQVRDFLGTTSCMVVGR